MVSVTKLIGIFGPTALGGPKPDEFERAIAVLGDRAARFECQGILAGRHGASLPARRFRVNPTDATPKG